MPILNINNNTDLQGVLSNGNTTGDQVISSTDGDSDVFIGDGGEITSRVLTTVLQLTGGNLSLTNGDFQLADETASRILSTDANSKVKSLSTATYPSLTELSRIKGVTSGVQTQLNSRIKIINETATDQTSVTGTTANTITYSFEIPANTFSVGCNPQFFLRYIYTGSAGTRTARFYLNSSNSLSGANLIGTFGASASNVLSVDLARSFSIKSATNTQVYTPTTSNATIQASATSAVAEYNIDWTASVWIICAIQLSNAADAGVLSYFKLTT